MKLRAAVVFDFDGTIVDSLPGLLVATNRLLLEAQRRPLTLMEVSTMLGGGVPRLLDHAFRLTGEPPADVAAAVERWRAHYDRYAPECTSLFPGVASLLSTLADHGVALGICTGKPLQATLKLANALGIGRFFGSVRGSDSTPTPKPHPGHLLAVLADLRVDTTRAIMVGDSEQDVRMAHAACVRSVRVGRGDTWGDAPAPAWAVECTGALGPVMHDFLQSAAAGPAHFPSR